jgi:hypothetical protein
MHKVDPTVPGISKLFLNKNLILRFIFGTAVTAVTSVQMIDTVSLFVNFVPSSKKLTYSSRSI